MRRWAEPPCQRYLCTHFELRLAHIVYMCSSLRVCVVGVYTWVKNQLGYRQSGRDAEGKLQLSSLYAPLVAGVVADAASVALYVPGDIIVQRLQLRNSPYSSFSDACRKIYRAEGIKGFFTGLTATFVTGGLASAVWWVVYENTKASLYAAQTPAAAPVSSSGNSSVWSEVWSVNRWPQINSGFIAGTITAVLINPLDVVKTRLQVQGAQNNTTAAAATTGAAASTAAPAAGSSRYRNMLHGMVRLWKDEGVRGFSRGLVPKLVSRGPLSAVSGLTYEVVLQLSRNQPAVAAHKQAFDQ